MGPDLVVGNREVPGIAPVPVEVGCDGEGFVELLASDALAPLDVAILFGTACWGTCMAMPRSWRSSSKAPRNSEPLSVRPHRFQRKILEQHPRQNSKSSGKSNFRAGTTCTYGRPRRKTVRVPPRARPRTSLRQARVHGGPPAAADSGHGSIRVPGTGFGK